MWRAFLKARRGAFRQKGWQASKHVSQTRKQGKHASRLSNPTGRQSMVQLDNPIKQAGCKVHVKAAHGITPGSEPLFRTCKWSRSKHNSKQARTCPRSRKQGQPWLQVKAAHKARQPLQAMQTTPQSEQVVKSVSQDA